MATAMVVDISIPLEALSHFLWKMGRVRLVTSSLRNRGHGAEPYFSQNIPSTTCTSGGYFDYAVASSDSSRG